VLLAGRDVSQEPTTDVLICGAGAAGLGWRSISPGVAPISA
jgi:hypothetical protein